MTAHDDRGLAIVRFFDGKRKLCTVTAPPYTCAFPAGRGRHELKVVATDVIGQATRIRRLVRART